MKKKIIVLGTLMFLLAAAQGFSFGIGLRASGGLDWGAGLLISPGSDSNDNGMHFGINYYFGEDAFHLGVTGDYWLLKPNLTSVGSGDLKFYLGGGLFVWINGGDEFGLGGGIRVPIGLDLDFDRVDIFAEFVPHIGLNLLPGIGFNTNWFNFAIGARFWF
jgi:hypothetical protein